jgi:hypothetical protein
MWLPMWHCWVCFTGSRHPAMVSKNTTVLWRLRCKKWITNVPRLLSAKITTSILLHDWAYYFEIKILWEFIIWNGWMKWNLRCLLTTKIGIQRHSLDEQICAAAPSRSVKGGKMNILNRKIYCTKIFKLLSWINFFLKLVVSVGGGHCDCLPRA